MKHIFIINPAAGKYDRTEEFSGKIEVHHIKPISEIGEECVVDPVRDLVPVCPNCHMMLHSKKDGVFTVEELKKLWRN